MARAKRTDRAEARRRSRALSAARPARDIEIDAGEAAAARPAAAPAARSGAGPNGAMPRPSFSGSLRASFRPLDVRGDLRALPKLLLHRAFLAPAVASGAAAILGMLASIGTIAPSQVIFIFYQYFSGQVPIGALLAAGFFAPRASWLIGAIIGVLSLAFQAPLFSSLGPADVLSYAFSGATAGALFAAMAAWYRRFLGSMNPNRNRPAATTSRRPDGKIPRKQQPRPMLARRR